VYAPQAKINQAQQHKYLASFRSQTLASANFGYSGSVFQFVGLTVYQHGGIDLPARLCGACGLNYRQINHLQRIASETHYRGHYVATKSGYRTAGEIGHS
jgi:hypothetical protein